MWGRGESRIVYPRASPFPIACLIHMPSLHQQLRSSGCPRGGGDGTRGVCRSLNHAYDTPSFFSHDLFFLFTVIRFILNRTCWSASFLARRRLNKTCLFLL